jgi:hypothetical protein
VLAADGLFGKSRSRPADPIVNILPSQSAARLDDEVGQEEVDFEDDVEDDENSSDSSDVENGKKRGSGAAGGGGGGEMSPVPATTTTETAIIQAI